MEVMHASINTLEMEGALTLPVHHGDVVLVRDGYNPVVAGTVTTPTP